MLYTTLLTLGAVEGLNIADCDGTPCGYGLCYNGGHCVPLESGQFRCNCTEVGVCVWLCGCVCVCMWVGGVLTSQIGHNPGKPCICFNSTLPCFYYTVLKYSRQRILLCDLTRIAPTYVMLEVNVTVLNITTLIMLYG